MKRMSIIWTEKHKIMKYEGILWKGDNTVSANAFNFLVA